MSQERPKLVIVQSSNGLAPGGVSWSAVCSALSGLYDVGAPGADGAAGARGAGPGAVLGDGADWAGPTPAGQLINALGEGVCLAEASGAVVWHNAEFAAYGEGVRMKVEAVCRQAAQGAAAGGAGPASGSGTGAGTIGDGRRRFEVSIDSGAVLPAGSAGGGGGGGGGGGAGGDARYFEVLVSPVPGPGGRVAAVVRDITVLRRQQLKMDAIDRAGDELVRLDRDLIRKMNTAERLRVIEQRIIKFAHDLLHFDQFAIRILDEKTGKLEIVMSQGLPSASLEVELYARREGHGISGFVAATGRSYICADTTTDPRYVVGIEHARSSLTVPLRLSDRVIGVFNVESTRPAAFTEEDRQFGEMFARWIAMALHFLDLLVVERVHVGQAVTGNVEGELAEPLEDIAQIAGKLRAALASVESGGASGAESAGLGGGARFIDRIMGDVEAIRRRLKDVASGPATILGAEKSLSDAAVDPVIAGKRIMIVDDDPRIRQIAAKVLRSRGAEVVTCENADTAIAALTQVGSGGGGGPAVSTARPGEERGGGLAAEGWGVAGGGGAFDLLVSDIRLPDKTGYEIFAAARRVQPDLPVILMTGFGYDPNHSIVRASQEGLSCVLFKPFPAERLIEETHKALSKAAAPAQGGQ